MRILVTGSRNWTDYTVLSRAIVETQAKLAPLQPDEYDYNNSDWTIVHGACPTGADAMADEFALCHWYKVERHPADWDKYGKYAGPKRNAEMVALGADVCIAFPLGISKGTRNCMKLAKAAGILVKNYGDPK